MQLVDVRTCPSESVALSRAPSTFRSVKSKPGWAEIDKTEPWSCTAQLADAAIKRWRSKKPLDIATFVTPTEFRVWKAAGLPIATAQ